MLERIATIITAVWFFGSLTVALFISTIEVISLILTGDTCTGISIDFLVIDIIFTPPVALILIYAGAGFDRLFNLQKK